jgi:drug/metabolite transporter (DMT)-like permease
MVALSLTLVAYVIALKRLSGLISVFLGYYFLKERKIKERLLGAFIMFLGVLLIVLS